MTLLKTGILNKKEILDRLSTNNIDKKICLTPMLDSSLQIGSNSIDIRLGTNFVAFKKTGFSLLDPISEDIKDKIGEYQEKIYVEFGSKIFLHPKQFILGSTLEYIHLPSDIMAYVTGRSSWGRLGLIIATATAIHPNYNGIITLELANLGEAPIALYPGIRIAQLIFHRTTPIKLKLISKYFMSVTPTFSKVYEEEDINILRALLDVNHR